MQTCYMCEKDLDLRTPHFTATITMFDTVYPIAVHATCLSRRSLGEQARYTPGVCV